MDEHIKRLREERLATHRRMAEIMAVGGESRSMTAEELSSWNEAQARFVALGKEIEARQAMAAVDASLAEPAPSRAAAGVPGTGPDHADEDRRAKYSKAFGQYMRVGQSRMNAEQRDLLEQGFQTVESRDMGAATGAAGGYTVPPGFLAKITEVKKFYGGMRSVANVIETATGNSLVWPVNDDTGNPAVIIGENTLVTEGDLVFTQNTLGAWLYNSKAVRIGRALLQDSAFNLEDVVGDRFGKRFGRGQNAHFTTGTGIGQPKGIVGVAAATGVTTFDYVGLVGLRFAVDVAYRNSGNCVYMMSDLGAKAAMLLVDSQGRPLWIPAGAYPSISSAQGDMILGHRIVINNDLDAPGATKSPALFGDFNAGYIIRDVIGSQVVLRLEERFADYGEVGFIGYERTDGNIDDPNAVRRLAMP